jgi:putative oxidoreductase
MDTIQAEPKPLLPFLSGFYSVVRDLSWVLVRIIPSVTVFLDGGYPKMIGGWTGLAAAMPKMGLGPPVPLTLFITFLETGGALCIVLGLFTRFFAAALAIEMAYITFFIMWSRGLQVYQLSLIWGLLFFAIALRGGGPYSLDRVIGREL